MTDLLKLLALQHLQPRAVNGVLTVTRATELTHHVTEPNLKCKLQLGIRHREAKEGIGNREEPGSRGLGLDGEEAVEMKVLDINVSFLLDHGNEAGLSCGSHIRGKQFLTESACPRPT